MRSVFTWQQQLPREAQEPKARALSASVTLSAAASESTLEVTTLKLPLKKSLLSKSVQPSKLPADGFENVSTPTFLC